MTKNEKEIIYSKPVIEMITVAHEYCLFIEEVNKTSKENIIQYLNKVCPLLYLKGTLLPRIGEADPEANERFVTEEQWEFIFNELRQKFRPDDEYWFMENDGNSENEPVKASLAENFADIYQDMKDFVMLYQKDGFNAKETAIYEFRYLFESHWGYRIVNAQMAIHYLLYKDNLFEDYTDLDR